MVHQITCNDSSKLQHYRRFLDSDQGYCNCVFRKSHCSCHAWAGTAITIAQYGTVDEQQNVDKIISILYVLHRLATVLCHQHPLRA